MTLYNESLDLRNLFAIKERSNDRVDDRFACTIQSEFVCATRQWARYPIARG